MLENLQKRVMLCLYMEHKFKRRRRMQDFLWVIYGSDRKILYQTTQVTFAGKANDKLYEGMELHTKHIRCSPEHQDHQANKQDNDGALAWKRCLGGGIYRVAHKNVPIFLWQQLLQNKETFKIFSPQILEFYRILLGETTLESIIFYYTFSVSILCSFHAPRCCMTAQQKLEH